jgi:ribosome-binding protein aMBF1 (putative translation factor)
MNPWLTRKRDAVPDLDILEEAALAMAQAVVQNAINRSGISRAELARRLNRSRSFVSRMLCGDHNLTVKTMARALAACGEEVRLGSEPITWAWPHIEHP